MKTFEDCKKEVAQKHKLGKTLVIGHLPKYYEEAANLYADQFKSGDSLKKLNFWSRLESFVSNVQVSDMPGEEEKQMILNICRIKK